MNNSTKVAVAVIGGYFLGRRRKARTALMLGSWLLGKRLNLNLQSLGREALGQLTAHPEIAKLGSSIRDELIQSVRGAALASVTGRMESLSDRLHERTATLNVPEVPGLATDSPESAPEPDADASEQDDERTDERDEAPQDRPRARRARRDPHQDEVSDDDPGADAKPARSATTKRTATRRTAATADKEEPRAARRRTSTSRTGTRQSDRPTKPRSSSRGTGTGRGRS